MAFEAEVIPMFLIGTGLVSLIELIAGWVLLEKHKEAKIWLTAHAVSMVAALIFLVRCIFAGRLNIELGIASISNSVNIAMFGIFWAISVCCLLRMVGVLVKNRKTDE